MFSGFTRSAILNREGKVGAKETSEAVDAARLIDLVHVAILVLDVCRVSASIGANVHVYTVFYVDKFSPTNLSLVRDLCNQLPLQTISAGRRTNCSTCLSARPIKSISKLCQTFVSSPTNLLNLVFRNVRLAPSPLFSDRFSLNGFRSGLGFITTRLVI